MVDQLPDGDRGPKIRELGYVLVNLVVQGQLAVLRKQDDGSVRELLRDRGDVEDGVRPDRHVVIQVGHAVAALVYDVTFLHHR